jgi:eukaryotic-like serine/threonine-protein kinase
VGLVITSETVLSLAPGSVLTERFEIVGVLGRGGMATVLLAHDRLRDERVALKLLHPHLADDVGMATRLKREVQAASRVRHPAALVAHELHQVDGHTFLTLPYHPGQTLSERVAAQGPLTPSAVRALGVRLAEALAQAHRGGVLHRDVNPNNVMVDVDDQAVLMDFGLARMQAGTTGHTTGVLGTTGYAAPEALDGHRGDPRSDLYGLGATLYLALTGKAPFDAATPLGVVQRQLEDDPTPPSELGVDMPPDLEATVLSLLAREPDERPQAAAEVASMLVEGQPPEAYVPVPAPSLPAGAWTVLVGETGDDKGRRDALRVDRGLRPSTTGLEVVRFLRNQVWGSVKQVFGIPDGMTSEALLTRSLARAAGLPDDALEMTEAMFEPRFRLVSGVDETTARALKTQASQAGFKAQIFQIAEPRAPRSLLRNPWAWTLVTLLAGGAAGVAAGGTLAGAVAVLLAIGTVLAWGVTSRPVGANRDQAWADALPLAFQALDAHLSPGHRIEATLVQRVRSRLDRLEAALDDGEAHFTPAALDSGRATLGRLRADAQALSQDLGQLDEQLSGAGASLRPDSELSWLASRRDRLQTLLRAGETVDPEELGRLTAELEDQADVAAVAEAVSARRTATTTRLLELGASAHRARQDLARAQAEEAPAGPALARLARANEALDDSRETTPRQSTRTTS